MNERYGRTSVCLLARWFLARLILDPEDGDDTFLRNVGSYTDYMKLYCKRRQLWNPKPLKKKKKLNTYTRLKLEFLSGMNLTIVNKCIPMRHT
jgi:hypothetical protein